MNKIFLLTIIAVFLPIFIESLFLILQLKGSLLTRMLGRNAFMVHAGITVFLWITAFFFIGTLQLYKHPFFHTNTFLKYTGLLAFLSGMAVSMWGFRILGLKRALCINFFYGNVPVVTSSLYKYIKNPIDFGFWSALIGLALFTRSTYNLVIAIEFILIMIPHTVLENIPLKQTMPLES